MYCPSFTLKGINLSDAEICNCDFTEVVFEDCSLGGAQFKGSNSFRYSDLRGCEIGNLQYKNNEVSNFKGAFVSKSQASDILSGLDIKVL